MDNKWVTNSRGWTITEIAVVVLTVVFFVFSVYSVQKKRDKACNDMLQSTSSCFSPLFALFDRTAKQTGKQWRCYYSNAVQKESNNGHFTLEYDDVLLSTCVSPKNSELITIH